LELFELRERFVVRLPDEDEPLLLLVGRLRPLLEEPEDRLRPPLEEPDDRLRPPLEEPEDRLRPPLEEPEDRLRPLLDEPDDRLRPPDELAACARLPLARREPLPPPDCEASFSSPSDEVTSPSSMVPRQAPDSSSFIITWALKRCRSARMARLTCRAPRANFSISEPGSTSTLSSIRVSRGASSWNVTTPWWLSP
jgi:hypothetical protein